ncbi:hypothetical protein TNCV_1336291 [Trichonephila clavipes]|nr:hypothetical protein TNCV_1336291 [Trichonephila clavipes]
MEPEVDALLLDFHSSSKKRVLEIATLDKSVLAQLTAPNTIQIKMQMFWNIKVQPTLLDNGLRSRRPPCGPLLTKFHCQSNLERAQKH